MGLKKNQIDNIICILNYLEIWSFKMQAEELHDVELMYIQNTSGNDYSVETTGRRTKTVKLNFSNVDGIEIDAKTPLQVKNSFIQMSDDQQKMWNIRFCYPTNLKIKYTGQIVIEVI